MQAPAGLPMAATMRPTLGSLPQMAVLTSGELTTLLPTARAIASDGRARHPHAQHVVDALAVAHEVLGQVGAHRLQRPGERRPVGRRATAPEASSATVSEVLVSLSMLIRLKVRSTIAGSSARSSARGTARSVSR